VVREVDSEDDEDEDEDDAEEVDAMDVDDDDDSDENDVDAEGDEDEDMDAEGDEDDDMEDTPAPRIAVNANRGIIVKPAPAIKLTKAQDRVEAKEMAMDDDDDDDDLSDPDSDLEEEDAEGEDDDAEGEEDDEMGVTPGGDMDDDMESDEDLSRDQTPDVSKMTKRQRALVTEEGDGTLLALSNEAQKKKHLTAEEHAMRRAEMARRRKNLSEKRNEEEKVRLLKYSTSCPATCTNFHFEARHHQPPAEKTTPETRPQSHAGRRWPR